uniref:C-type lectin domain family 4 member G-like n=2 Tax=Xiphophorus maculatus TaxID=8083 RepID=M4AFS6_XIPMA
MVVGFLLNFLFLPTTQTNFSSKVVEMAEDEVQHASVAIKRKRPSRAKIQEEVVYDEVKIPNQTAQQTSDTKGLLPDEEERRFCWYKKLTCCFGTLCVILVLAVIGVFVFLHKSKLNQLEINQTALLQKNVNLTQQNQNLTTELNQVKKINQELQTWKKNLTEQIESIKNEQNVSRAQWSIDQYCPKNKGRRCVSCQDGWLDFQSSCYAVNDAEPRNQKTWEEAREDCKGKSSDLTVVGNEEEKMFLKDKSWFKDNINGYWIGLRAVKGIWKWVDGSDLTNQSWLEKPATEGQCVTSLQNREWKSVNCSDRNGWICEKKALSV